MVGNPLIGDLLDMCVIDYARNFDTAEKYLIENYYDAAVFDKNFGSDWQLEHEEDLKDLNLTHTREELEKIL